MVSRLVLYICNLCLCIEVLRLKRDERAIWILDQWFSQRHLIRSEWLQERMISLGGTLVIFFSWSLKWRSSCFFHYLRLIGLSFNSFLWSDIVFNIFSWCPKHCWISFVLILSLLHSLFLSLILSLNLNLILSLDSVFFFDNLKFNFWCWCNWFFKLIFNLLLLGINRQLWLFFGGSCWCSRSHSWSGSWSSSCWKKWFFTSVFPNKCWLSFLIYFFFFFFGNFAIRWSFSFEFFSTSWCNSTICYNQFLS